MPVRLLGTSDRATRASTRLFIGRQPRLLPTHPGSEVSKHAAQVSSRVLDEHASHFSNERLHIHFGQLHVLFEGSVLPLQLTEIMLKLLGSFVREAGLGSGAVLG